MNKILHSGATKLCYCFKIGEQTNDLQKGVIYRYEIMTHGRVRVFKSVYYADCKLKPIMEDETFIRMTKNEFNRFFRTLDILR